MQNPRQLHEYLKVIWQDVFKIKKEFESHDAEQISWSLNLNYLTNNNVELVEDILDALSAKYDIDLSIFTGYDSLSSIILYLYLFSPYWQIFFSPIQELNQFLTMEDILEIVYD